MYFLSLQLIDNQEYVFVKLTFSSGLNYLHQIWQYYTFVVPLRLNLCCRYRYVLLS